MIVIAGPGRSGTSLVAAAYKQAGVDPGGIWYDTVNAGLEDPEIVDLNARLCRALGISLLGTKRVAPVPPSHGHWSSLRRAIGEQNRQRLRTAYGRFYKWYESASFLPFDRPSLAINWDLADTVVADFGQEIRTAASTRLLAKDPQFSYTLPIWIRAGASIEHVIVCIRNSADMLHSRTTANHLRYKRPTDARNALIYAYGVLSSTIVDYSIPHTRLEFPDWISEADCAIEHLPLVAGLTRQALRSAVLDTIAPSLVHSRS